MKGRRTDLCVFLIFIHFVSQISFYIPRTLLGSYLYRLPYKDTMSVSEVSRDLELFHSSFHRFTLQIYRQRTYRTGIRKLLISSKWPVNTVNGCYRDYSYNVFLQRVNSVPMASTDWKWCLWICLTAFSRDREFLRWYWKRTENLGQRDFLSFKRFPFFINGVLEIYSLSYRL